MIKKPLITNREICQRVNDYWENKGFSANARIEKKTIKLPATYYMLDKVRVDLPEKITTVEMVVSDLVDGRPPKKNILSGWLH